MGLAPAYRLQGDRRYCREVTCYAELKSNFVPQRGPARFTRKGHYRTTPMSLMTFAHLALSARS